MPDIPDDLVPILCAAAMRPSRFAARGPLRLEHRETEEIVWEVFLGRLLDDRQTRERRGFASWNLFASNAAEPLLAVKWDGTTREIHVVRAILCRVHVGYDAGGSTFETREEERWQRELVGTIRVGGWSDEHSLADELAHLLFEAVAGTSRLPLTSLEAPLPEFTLGRLNYPGIDAAKDLEWAIRSTPAADIASLNCDIRAIREVFNGVSLSPYDDFVAKCLALVRANADAEDRADLLSHLSRQLGRHLAAYDLVTFHHRGANYPDALLADELFAELSALAVERPDLFATPARRRGLRVGRLIRSEYAGQLVPDAPTSPGENARVLPSPFRRVPDDQIETHYARDRRLFDTVAPPDSEAVRASLADLALDSELLELGTAVYLDRPLGAAKAVGEPDQTPILGQIVFSRMIAEARLSRLRRSKDRCLDDIAIDALMARLAVLEVDGLPFSPGPQPRPGVLSLHDALNAADDLVFLRTTRRSIRELRAVFDLADVSLPPDDWRFVLPGEENGRVTLTIHDRAKVARVRFEADCSMGYCRRSGVEWPSQGLRESVFRARRESEV